MNDQTKYSVWSDLSGRWIINNASWQDAINLAHSNVQPFHTNRVCTRTYNPKSTGYDCTEYYRTLPKYRG